MDTKNQLLYFLERHRGEVVSGETVAKELFVTRAAVWKAAQTLKEQGVCFSSAPGSGYQLQGVNDMLMEGGLRAYLADGQLPVKVLREVDSTNTQAKAWAVEGAPHGSLVLAARQTGGRGRLGRCFESPEGGLYMSVILRPGSKQAAAVMVTAAAAVVVCRAVQELCNIKLGIKWVNDLFFGDKKCCGILTEAGTGFESGTIEYIVVGIGLNYTTPPGHFENTGKGVAASLYPFGEPPVSRVRLAAEIHSKLLRAFEDLADPAMLEEYRRRSIVLGRQVEVLASPAFLAKAVAINDKAELVVRLEDGTEKTVSYGEISIKV